MNQEQKQIFYWNIVKFIIGIILLSISYNYIQNHPAERASIISGFEVMYERGQLFVYDVIGRDTSILRQKHRIDQYYQELVKMGESRTCVPPKLLSQIYDIYNNFLSTNITQLSQQTDYYVNKAIEFDKEINEVCK